MKTITIDNDPANIRAMMAVGHFHSHQDGRWRYSPFGGGTVHVTPSPIARFEKSADLSHGYAAAAHPTAGLFARIYGDGTRGVYEWNSRHEHVLAQLYGPRNAGCAAQRKWFFDTFDA